MIRKLYILCFLVLSMHGFAQSQLWDTVSYALQQKPRVSLGFHNRNTFVNTSKVQLYGVIAGLDYNKQLKIFFGLYGFGGEEKKIITNDLRFGNDTIERSTSVSNLSLGIEYTFLRNGRWSFSLPIQFGFGGVSRNYYKGPELVLRKDQAVVPIESGINAHYEILPWLGLKGGAGYRLSLGRTEVFQLSAPYYNFGLSFSLIELYNGIKQTIKDHQS